MENCLYLYYVAIICVQKYIHIVFFRYCIINWRASCGSQVNSAWPSHCG